MVILRAYTCETLFYNSGLDDILKNKDFYVKMLWIKYFMVIYFKPLL